MSHIRKLPAQEERVESGPIQFGDDWTGTFFRGDHAVHFAMLIEEALITSQIGAIYKEGLMEYMKNLQGSRI